MTCSLTILLSAYSALATLVYSVLGILLSHCGKKSLNEKKVNNGRETIIDKIEIGLVIVDQSEVGLCNCDSSSFPSITWTVLEILVLLAMGSVGLFWLWKGIRSFVTSWNERKQKQEAEKSRLAEEMREKIRNEERVRFSSQTEGVPTVKTLPRVELEYKKGDDN